MLQALVNVWWLFAAGFALGAIMVLSAMRTNKVNSGEHWTKTASSFFGDVLSYILGWIAMIVCGILLLICAIGALV